jgi:hypothetical protein
MTHHLTLGLAAALVLAACAGHQQLDNQPPTTLRVDNRSALDMNLYVIASAQRVRLGTAHALTTTRLTIPKHHVFVASPLRVLADPIGSNRMPVSDAITLSPGDELSVTISATGDMVYPTGVAYSRRRTPLP